MYMSKPVCSFSPCVFNQTYFDLYLLTPDLHQIVALNEHVKMFANYMGLNLIFWELWVKIPIYS